MKDKSERRIPREGGEEQDCPKSDKDDKKSLTVSDMGRERRDSESIGGGVDEQLPSGGGEDDDAGGPEKSEGEGAGEGVDEEAEGAGEGIGESAGGDAGSEGEEGQCEDMDADESVSSGAGGVGAAHMREYSSFAP